MKKLLSSILIVTLILSFSACGSKEPVPDIITPTDVVDALNPLNTLPEESATDKTQEVTESVIEEPIAEEWVTRNMPLPELPK